MTFQGQHLGSVIKDPLGRPYSNLITNFVKQFDSDLVSSFEICLKAVTQLARAITQTFQYELQYFGESRTGSLLLRKCSINNVMYRK